MNPFHSGYTTIRHATILSGNIPLHVAEAGSGELVILLHGFPDFWYGWRHLLVDLGQDFLVVAPDGRGYNLSGKPDSIAAYSIDTLCHDILALVEHYQSDRCILVGHDWGGMVAWFFAARYPSLVRRLVIVNSPHPVLFQSRLHSDRIQRAASQYITRLRDSGYEARLASVGLEAFWRGTFGALEDRGIFGVEDKAAYLEAWSKPGALTGMLNWYRSSPFIVPRLDEAFRTEEYYDATFAEFGELYINVHTLVIWGMEDRVFSPILLEGLDRFVSSLHVERLSGIGHGPIHEIPGTVGTLIREFSKEGSQDPE